MSSGLLDTSIVIAETDDPELAALLPEELAISVATLAELHFGVLAAKNADARKSRLRRLETTQATFQVLDIDSTVAQAFAQLAQAVKMAGRQPRSRTMDLWIAATALSYGVPVYTRNPDDFLGLESLLEIRVV